MLRTNGHNEGATMAAEGWTYQDLVEKLGEFEAELRRAGLKESTVRTYVDRSETFLRWLVGRFKPHGPNF
jgi:hypothetical protein